MKFDVTLPVLDYDEKTPLAGKNGEGSTWTYGELFNAVFNHPVFQTPPDKKQVGFTISCKVADIPGNDLTAVEFDAATEIPAIIERVNEVGQTIEDGRTRQFFAGAGVSKGDPRKGTNEGTAE